MNSLEERENVDSDGGQQEEHVDPWSIVPADKENGKAPLEESSFATLFPKYREKYIREVWPLVTKSLKTYGLGCELNLIEGSMTVRTTRKCWDPCAILNARDFIKMLARSIHVQQALKIFQDDVYCEIIKIKNMVRNKERFAKRRQRLVGPNGCTLKAIELVTDCYVLVQGNTVAAMGSHKGLQLVRGIVVDCMKNIHPIYTIKQLMIRKELENDSGMATEDWSRFLPQFKKKNVKRKKPKKIGKKKKDKSIFPPEQAERKEDIQLASGEYFLSQTQKKVMADEKRRDESRKRKIERLEERKSLYVPPTEEPKTKKKKFAAEPEDNTADQIRKLKQKFKAQKEKEDEQVGKASSQFIIGSEPVDSAAAGKKKRSRKRSKKAQVEA